MKTIRLLTILMCAPLMALRGHDDLRFASGASALGIPFERSNHHIALQARLNDQDGMWLVLDTGAGGSVVDEKRAEALGLHAVGTHQALGAGGFETGSTVHGVTVGLPGLELLDQTMDTLPLGPIAAQAGRPLDGILGHPLFSRCVVEVDYPRQSLSVFDAAGYRYTGSGVSVPLTFKNNLPYVRARVVLPDGRSISGKFVIDTGAATNLILAPSTVEREGVLPALGKTITVQARGVGGMRDIRLARVARLELGEFSLEQPIAALQPAGVGRISAEGTVGNIGGGILSRFKVIFDYPRRRMILEPGPDVARPFEADMSGLSLVAVPPDFRRVTVSRVFDGSPALEAGIQAGDELVTVDGTPTGDIGLTALRERLRLEGRDIRLELLRGTERITLEMRTRRLI
jgi:predicted aspartyl protease